MIFDSLKNSNMYYGLHKNFEKAFDFIKRVENENLPAGKYEIDGTEVYAIVQEYDSKNPADFQFEGHKKYIDIQYILSGTEVIEVLNIKNATAVTDYIPEREVQFYEGDESSIKRIMEPGEYGIFYPDDIHKPGLMNGDKPEPIRKVLVKVMVEEMQETAESKTPTVEPIIQDINTENKKDVKPKGKAKGWIIAVIAFLITALIITGLVVYFWPKKEVYQENNLYSNGLVPVGYGKNRADPDWGWGYANEKGEVIIDPEFQMAYPFSEGLAAVQNNDGKLGYINTKGDYVIEPKFHRAGLFSDGLAPVMNEDNLWGYIDKKGEYVIKPQYIQAEKFVDGIAVVKDDSGYFCINKKGEKIESGLCSYDYYIKPSSEDLHIATDYGTGFFNLNNMDFINTDIIGAFVPEEIELPKVGYADKEGKFIIEPIYDRAYPFSEGIALVYLDGEYMYIDTKGKVIFKLSTSTHPQGIEDWYYRAHETKVSADFHEGLAAVQDEYGDWGYINKKGEYEIAPRFDNVSYFSDGFALVEENGKYGYINKKGEYVIEPKFEEARSFHKGIAAVSNGEEWGFINKKGEFIVQPKYRNVRVKDDGYTLAMNDDWNWVIVNEKGEELGEFYYVYCWELNVSPR